MAPKLYGRHTRAGAEAVHQSAEKVVPVGSYSGAAQDIWEIPRQHRDLKGLLHGLKDLGVKGLTNQITSDELDAVTAALVGRWFLLGKGEMLGGAEGILIPKSQLKPISLKGKKELRERPQS